MEKNYSPILVGQIDLRQVYIEYNEYLNILKFAKAGGSDGSRGILLGQRVGEKIYIYKVLEAVYSGIEGVEMPVFTPESWGIFEADIKEYYSSLEILGQFSTHSSVEPNRNDYIMQDKYLPKSANLLYVFDPTENEEKFYRYDSREFNFLNGFYLFDKFENKISLNKREAIICSFNREYEMRLRFYNDISNKIKKQNNIYLIITLIILSLTFCTIFRQFGIEKMLSSFTSENEERIEWKSGLNN